MSTRIVKCEQWGRYTVAEAISDSGIRGTGISRRAFMDKKNDNLGSRIAEGRAIEAVQRKELKKPITSNFMG